jgi:hypothetical protein
MPFPKGLLPVARVEDNRYITLVSLARDFQTETILYQMWIAKAGSIVPGDHIQRPLPQAASLTPQQETLGADLRPAFGR